MGGCTNLKVVFRITLIVLVIGKAQFRRAMLSCDSSCLLCVHMAFKDQQNLSKVEMLFYKSNSYFLELRTCLNILIWILQENKLLLGESTYATMHML